MYVRTNTAYEYRVTNSKITFSEREAAEATGGMNKTHSQQRNTKQLVI